VPHLPPRETRRIYAPPPRRRRGMLDPTCAVATGFLVLGCLAGEVVLLQYMDQRRAQERAAVRAAKQD
jgi:hypothetical protein